MAYRLEPLEPLGEGLARIAREQAERAAQELESGNGARAIHQARARFKKVRAVIRLGRPTLGPAYRRENARFREAARAIAFARDADSMLEAADTLGRRAGEAMSPEALSAFRASLERRRAKAVREAGDLETAAAGARKAALDGAKALGKAHWPSDFADVSQALVAIYRSARTAMRHAFETAEVEAFHDWRKDVKYHWRHTQILAFLWPGVFEPRAAGLRDLGQMLGDDHDFALLAERVRAWRRAKGRAEPARALMAAIEAERTRLKAQSQAAGATLLGDPPKALRLRYEALWALARKG